MLLVEVGSQVMGGKMGRYLVKISGDVLMTDLVLKLENIIIF